MAKDPAFLFYSTDFFMGTVEMSDEQVGQYIRLMCLQHQKGHLSEQTMLSVMHGQRDELVLSKFKVDEGGCYFNARLEAETEKRQRFTSSRARNLKRAQEDAYGIDAHMEDLVETHMDAHTGGHMDNHMDAHMENHTDAHLESHTALRMENEIYTLSPGIGTTLDTTSGTKKEQRRKRGEYGWVRLTDSEYQKLAKDLGEAELARCIQYIDESAQGNGNKNKWRDWNLVIRKCSREGWGRGRQPLSKKPMNDDDYRISGNPFLK